MTDAQCFNQLGWSHAAIYLLGWGTSVFWAGRLLGWILADAYSHLRWHTITGDAGVLGIMAGSHGVSLAFGRRHLWLWRRETVDERNARIIHESKAKQEMYR